MIYVKEICITNFYKQTFRIFKNISYNFPPSKLYITEKCLIINIWLNKEQVPDAYMLVTSNVGLF